jgi:hypothetical protein
MIGWEIRRRSGWARRPPLARGPETPCDERRGLDQRHRSGRARLRRRRAAGETLAMGVIANGDKEIGWDNPRLTDQSGRRCAAEAIATTPKVGGRLMVVVCGFGPGMVVLFGAGFCVDAPEMKRRVGVAARECKRKQHHQASNPARSHWTRDRSSYRHIWQCADADVKPTRRGLAEFRSRVSPFPDARRASRLCAAEAEQPLKGSGHAQ